MDNADLERLKISPGRLVPKFNPTTTQYTVTLSSNVCEVKLTTITSDSGASTTIKGDATGKIVQLQEGKTSVVDIVVTAEDGHSTKPYTVSFHRLSADDACLSQLDISVGKLQPSFSPSVLEYYCDLPSNITQVAIKTKTEDPKITVALKGGAPVGTVSLSAGLTVVDITATSPNNKNTTTYTINALRLQSPYCFQLNHPNPSLECAACNGIPHCPCRVNGNTDHLYCRQCLMELSRVNKMDPMTSRSLGEGWMIIDHKSDKILSEHIAIGNTPVGKIEGKIGQLPLLIAQRNIQDEEITVACGDCSKKVPTVLIDAHKQLSCSANLPDETPIKLETKLMTVNSIPGDDSLSADIEELVSLAANAEEKYLAMLKDQDLASCSSADILQYVNRAGTCYTMMIWTSPKDPRGHVGLGIVLEELFYVGDMYGVKENESSRDDIDESEAEISSKEEEFLAICKLHGVTETANLAQQLRAVEAEYKSLQQSGQSHKAEHVQQLYQWKSKKALEASKGSLAVDTESLIYKAKMKFEQAVSLKPTDHSACYHLGRLCLLLGDLATAEKWLKIAASHKPTHSPTLLCLGKCLVPSSTAHAKALIAYGLGVYIKTRDDISVGKKCANLQSLHGNEFWRPTNTLIGESFIDLGNLGGHSFFDTSSCYKMASSLFSLTPGLQKGSTVNQLLWILIRARAALADIDIKHKAVYAGQICQQVSALINHCRLPPTEDLRTLQIKVFEDGVTLQPTNSVALSRLGTGQLYQYEATNDVTWLQNAEKSYRASIACEGKTDNGSEPPLEISEQGWWKKRNAKTSAAGSAPPTNKPASSAPPTNKPATATALKNVTKPVGGGRTAAKQTPTTITGRGRQPVVNKPVVNKPVVNKPGAGRGTGGAQGIGRGNKGKGVATLGELSKKPITTTTTTTTATTTTTKQSQKDLAKTDAPKQPDAQQPNESASSSSSVTSKPIKLNEVSYQPRLGLARVLAKSDDKKEESVALYNEVINMAPSVHDAYIELGEVLAPSNPTGAVAVYSKFPFSDPPSFDDAYLHGEIIRLLMSSSSFDDPQLVISMIAMGKALGIGVLDKTVATLEAKFKTKILKKVYAGVHGKDVDNPELQAFFKFKCWT